MKVAKRFLQVCVTIVALFVMAVVFLPSFLAEWYTEKQKEKQKLPY